MKKCEVLIVFLIVIGSMLFGNEVLAKDISVRATLPDFDVRLNGNKVDNSYRQYPLLVYKDMTYFPMTWYDCRLLGLETKYAPNEGLNVFQSKVTSSYNGYKTNRKNPKSNTATIANFKIAVNGQSIDNSKQEYPLLNFRGVTYFPLTWEFAHNKFGWDYVWNKASGLSVNSTNPQVKTVMMPKNVNEENGVVLFKGNYYFVETENRENKMYRASENYLNNKQLIYLYEFEYTPILSYYIKDGKMWFRYHVGGAVMGRDVYCSIDDNGKVTTEESGYLDFIKTNNGKIKIYQGPMPVKSNMEFIPNNQEQGNVIGSLNHIYHEIVGVENTGEYVYVTTSNYYENMNDINKIYKVNIATGKAENIVDVEVKNAKIINDRLYYVKLSDELLYSSNLQGKDEKKLSENKIDGYYGKEYMELDGNIYYMSEKGDDLFNVYKVDVEKEDTLILTEYVENMQILNDKLVCKLKDDKDYGVKIFDKDGNEYLKVTDKASKVTIGDNNIVLTCDDKNTIKVLKIQ